MADRTTIVLPVDLKRSAKEAARQEGISFAEYVRRSLEFRLSVPGTGDQSTTDPFLDDPDVFEGPTPGDDSTNHDEYLYPEQ